MVIGSGNAGFGKDWSGCDSVRTAVSAASVSKPRRSATHEQREEIDPRCSALLCCTLTAKNVKLLIFTLSAQSDDC